MSLADSNTNNSGSIFWDSKDTKNLFEYNKLGTFEALWELDVPWFEAPNKRRNGWSGVVKHILKDAQGNIVRVFIKRQENHNCKSILHPFKGIPTFYREFVNIKKCHAHNIPSLTALYYGEHKTKQKQQAILITLSLEGYQDLASFYQNNNHQNNQAVMVKAGQVIRMLHDAHYRHHSLYPKHIFVKDQSLAEENNNLDIRIIDLEKLKWWPFCKQIRLRELTQFIRHSNFIAKKDIVLFLNSYFDSGSHSLKNSSLAKQLLKPDSN